MEFRRISDIPPTVCGLIFTYSSICALKIKHYYWEWFNFWSYRNVESGRCTKNQVLRNGIELLRQVHALPDQFGTRKRFCLWIPWKSVISRFLRENLHLKRPLFQEDLGYFCNSLSWHSLMFPHSWGCNRLRRALVLFEMFCPSLKRRSSTRLRWEFCCFLCKCSEMCWSRQKRGGQGVSWVGSKPNTWASPNPTWASRYLESQMLTTCGCCVPLPTNAVHGTLTPCRFQGFCRLSSVDLGW